jgi:hypothetical protein
VPTASGLRAGCDAPLQIDLRHGPLPACQSKSMTGQVHTSDLLKKIIAEAPDGTVDLDWILGHLQKRAFGLLLLILAIANLVPGLGIVASVAIAFPAVEMMFARDRPTLPRFLRKRSFSTERFTHWAERSLPFLRSVERVSRSRWNTPAEPTKRAVGLLVLFLAVSGIWPLPLINVLPAVTIALIAMAYLQDDGLLLAGSFVVGILSLIVFGFLVWTSAGALENLLGAWVHLPGRKS